MYGEYEVDEINGKGPSRRAKHVTLRGTSPTAVVTRCATSASAHENGRLPKNIENASDVKGGRRPRDGVSVPASKSSFSARPSTSAPSNSCNAAAAALWLEKSKYPNPRDLPVFLFFSIRAVNPPVGTPRPAASDAKLSSSYVNGRFPTKTIVDGDAKASSPKSAPEASPSRSGVERKKAGMQPIRKPDTHTQRTATRRTLTRRTIAIGRKK